MPKPVAETATLLPPAPPSGGAGALLRVQGVGKRFGELEVLKDVSFDVAEREVFGIAGPNGAGKSTLFNLIAGTFSGSGRIGFAGEEIMGLPAHRVCHKGVARTFQIPVLFSSLTVEENVRVGAHFGGGRRHERELIADALKIVGMAGKEGQTVRRLDLLGKKLTMLASALATAPRLVMLDEPMGGLSPIEAGQFGALIGRLNTELGITILVIEHQIRKLVELSDRMMILDHGEEIALGTPNEVVNDPTVVHLYLGTTACA